MIILQMRGTAARLVALLTPGVGLTVIAALAGDLGLDPVVGWGPKRTTLLVLGLILTFLGDCIGGTWTRVTSWSAD